MKKLHQLSAGVLCLLFASCVTVPKPRYESTATYVDYGSITSQTGIFLTEATSLTQSYEGLGSVSAFVQDGYEIIATNATDTVIEKTIDPLYGLITHNKKRKIKYGDYKLASPLEAVRIAANKAKEMGANGIINLQIRTMPGDRTSYTATGMAVKIN